MNVDTVDSPEEPHTFSKFGRPWSSPLGLHCGIVGKPGNVRWRLCSGDIHQMSLGRFESAQPSSKLRDKSDITARGRSSLPYINLIWSGREPYHVSWYLVLSPTIPHFQDLLTVASRNRNSCDAHQHSTLALSAVMDHVRCTAKSGVDVGRGGATSPGPSFRVVSLRLLATFLQLHPTPKRTPSFFHHTLSAFSGICVHIPVHVRCRPVVHQPRQWQSRS